MFYWDALDERWDGAYVVYAPLTHWASRSEWMVPGSWRDID